MGLSLVIRLSLFLGVAFCGDIQLTRKQIDYFKNHLEEWGAPAVREPTEGHVERMEGGKTLHFSYESVDNQSCTTFFTKLKNGKRGHGWNCKGHVHKVNGDLILDSSEEDDDV